MKSWNYYNLMENEYEIPSAQSSMKIDDFSLTDDPALEIIMNSAKNYRNYQEIVRCLREVQR